VGRTVFWDPSFFVRVGEVLTVLLVSQVEEKIGGGDAEGLQPEE
jgi:hypothetical protein